ncbi:MAG: TolC family protein [Balneolales bacterium]|nr:TolC family protein [Balneolales bacterium]
MAKAVFLALLITALASGERILAQVEAQQVSVEEAVVQVSLDEAIQIAMVNNYMLRRGALDIDNANAQVREAWSSVYPQLSGSAQYTRNIKVPNPFAGSDAGGFFEAFGAIEWLAFNEERRTDGNPETMPIPFDEFLERQVQGYRDAGLTPPGFDSDNPFAIENEFQFGLNLTQPLYNGSAFAAIRGARQLKEVNINQFERDRQLIASDITEAYLGALLAEEQLRVIQSSVNRLRRTVEDSRRSVEAGVLTRADRLSAEVELVNLETDKISIENQAYLAKKNLLLLLGLPVKGEIVLTDVLDADPMSLLDEIPDTIESYEKAMRMRPDVLQIDNVVELLEVQRGITRAQYFPVVNAFANLAYIGQVPDNRQVVSRIPGTEFGFQGSRNNFFSDNYWSPAFNVGVSLSWSIFDGFRTSSQIQQNTIEIKQAEIDKQLLHNAIYLEVEQAVRGLETALRRIQSQSRNIEQARLNYEIASTRLREGVGNTLEERQASSLLDQSRLNYLSAMFDYRVAVARYKTTTGSWQLASPEN